MQRRLSPILFTLFFASGFCSLLYQVVWLRKAFAAFGIVTPVLSVVLSVFMLGLATGSWVGGSLARIWRKRTNTSPIILYGLAELIIGAGAFVVPQAFIIGERWLLTSGTMDSYHYLIQSAGIITISLFPWCFCMGATFPLMMAFIKEVEKSETGSFSFLYVANVLGAMCGVATTAIFLVELWGFSATLTIAATGNAAIAITSFMLGVRYHASSRVETMESFSQAMTLDRSKEILIWIVLFLTGFCSMAMEVAWVRTFTPILRTAIYSFAGLLVLYLLATWMGSTLYKRHVRLGRATSMENLFVFCAATAVLSIVVNDPRLRLHAAGVVLSVFPFCMVLGYLTPMLIDLYSAGLPRRGGRAYAVNTLGCILGPLFSGYLLLPYVSLKWGFVLLACPFVLLGLYAAFKMQRPVVRRNVFFSVTSSMVMIVGAGLSITYEQPSLYTNGETRRDYTATVISEGVGLEKRLLVNGIGITNLTPITKMMAHLPLAFHQLKPERALNICFGMGTTFRSLASWGIETTAVELVPSVRDAFGYYFADATTVTKNLKAKIIVDDGRRFLKRTDEYFDVITIDPPPPVEMSGSGLLYSKEFYDLIKLRLSDDGILQQWFPSGEKKILQAVARSLVDSFPYVHAFHSVEGWGYHFFASEQPIVVPSAQEMMARIPKLAKQDMMEWYDPIHNPDQKIEMIVQNALSREINIEELLTTDTTVLVSDDKPYNEYFLLRRLTDLAHHRYERAQ